MKISRIQIVFLSSLTMLLVAGCGGGDGISDGRVPASGTITFDGNPLEKGSIGFISEDGSTGVGTIRNGEFSMTQSASSKGIMPGTYKVSVTSMKIEPGQEDKDGNINMNGESAIPVKYKNPQESGLTATVAEGGSSDISIELKSGK